MEILINNNFDLNIKNYFQTKNLMFYDTNLITNSTKNEIINLVEKYPKRIQEQIHNEYIFYIYKKIFNNSRN